MNRVRKVLIIEDEIPAVKRMVSMIKKHRPNWIIIEIIDTIEESVHFIENNNEFDLIFMDIQLADGHSFDIFNHVKLTKPVIFATAYDEYAIKAFKVNGLDYLLKPLTDKDFLRAINKFEQLWNQDLRDISELLSSINTNQQNYKSRYLIKIGDHYKFIAVADIAYFLYEDGYTKIVTRKNDHFLLEESIESIIKTLNPSSFFQINRKFILELNSIDKIYSYFNSRLKIELKPNYSEDIIVSRERVKAFKQFLNQ